MEKMSPITEAVLTVEVLEGREKASALLCEFIQELERVYRARGDKGEVAKMTPQERVGKYKALKIELNAVINRVDTITIEMGDLWKAMSPEEEDQVDPDGASFRGAIRASSKPLEACTCPETKLKGGENAKCPACRRVERDR